MKRREQALLQARQGCAGRNEHLIRIRRSGGPAARPGLGGDSFLRLGNVDVGEKQIPEFGVLQMS